MSTQEAQVLTPQETEHALAPISWKTPIILTVLSAVVIVFVVLSAGQTQFQLDTLVSFWTIAPFSLPAQPAAITAFVLCVLLTAYSWWATSQRIRNRLWLPIVFGVVWVFAFLTWWGAGQSGQIPVTGLLSGALGLSVPLIFGSLAGCVGEHAGVINVAIEGDLLFGAFLAAVVGSMTGSAWIGLIAAPIAGALIGCLLALFAVRYWVDHIIVGVVLNVFVLGLTNYLFNGVVAPNPTLSAAVTTLPTLPIPLLSQIPIIGPILFNGNIILYLMYIAVIGLQFMLFRSRWGLRMRAVGEHPEAADTVGIKVNRTRMRNAVLGSAIAGLGGAYLTVAAEPGALPFAQNMSSGKGYIALAAMILGKWNPKNAALACLLFGFAMNAQQSLGIVNSALPSQFLNMVPYVITVIAVAGLVGRVRPPAMEGVAYKG